ncbi:MAG: hypothetical protein Q9160_000858 [Pyrenula sp. 1 TL-2023]
MTQTQLHINPIQHQPVFPYDHASPSMSSYPFSPQHAPPGADPYRNSPVGPHSSTQAVNLPPIRSIESHQQPPPQPSPSPLSAVSNPSTQCCSKLRPSDGPYAFLLPTFNGRLLCATDGGRADDNEYSFQPPGFAISHPSRRPQQDALRRETQEGGEKADQNWVSDMPKAKNKGIQRPCVERASNFLIGMELCDEAQPTCRNCQKSKRECAGYDPIFKPQTGPSSIQPASKLAQPASPASTQSYITSSLTQAQSHSQSHSATTDSPRSPYSQSDAIPSQSGDPNFSTTVYPYGTSPETGLPPPGITSFPSTALPTVSSNAPGAKNSLIPIYRFFEARFWQSEAVLQRADRNGAVTRLYRDFLKRLADHTHSKQPAILSEEAKLIWALFRLCQVPSTTSNGTQWVSQPEEAQRQNQLVQRLRVLEALLAGEYLSTNPLSPPSQTTSNTGISNQLKQREMEFWFCIGQIVSIRETDASSAKLLDDSLARCRSNLSKFEQRDVVYSIAIVRHVGRRWGGVMQPGPGVAEAKKEYDVATGFLKREAMEGTNSVIQRICSMATKIWM